jgi:hypothetical protein
MHDIPLRGPPGPGECLSEPVVSSQRVTDPGRAFILPRRARIGHLAKAKSPRWVMYLRVFYDILDEGSQPNLTIRGQVSGRIWS